MSAVVIDNSVVGAFLLPDENDPVADAIIERLEDMPGDAPLIWWAEVRNLLLVAERRKRIDRDLADTLLATVERLPIRLDREASGDEAMALARAHRLTLYDALYLELARRRQIPLATLDKALAGAARSEGIALAADPI